MTKRIIEGVVISDKGDKTVIVKVERTPLHPTVAKTVHLSKKFHGRDAKALKDVSASARDRQTAAGISKVEEQSQDAFAERLRQIGA